MKHSDNEMEMAVLGSMIADRSIIKNVMHAVYESDFSNPFNRLLFKKIAELNGQKKQIDIMNLNAMTENQNPGYVASLTDVVPSGANWAYYCDRVKKLSMTRSFYKLLAEVKDARPENIGEILGQVVSTASQIAAESGADDIKACRDYILPMINEIEQAIKTRGAYSGYDSGLQNLNKITDGIKSEYIIIGARASIGKTALAMNICKNIARQNIPIGYFSLEMSNTALLKRVLSDMAHVQAGAINGGLLSDAGATKVCNKALELAEYPIYPVDNTRGRFEKIVSMSRYMVRCLDVKVIMIDHASLMKYHDRKIQRHEQFAEMSNELQNLQRELDVPIILLAQLGRESEGRKPTIADLRESGGFEQDADQIWLMHRERAKSNEETEIPAEINIAKNRNGACGLVELIFQPQYVRFVDKAEKRYEK